MLTSLVAQVERLNKKVNNMVMTKQLTQVVSCEICERAYTIHDCPATKLDDVQEQVNFMGNNF